MITKNINCHISMHHMVSLDAIFSIEDGEVLEGSLPKNKLKLVHAWIEIHREDLVADWRLAVSGQNPLSIKPLE